MRWMKTIAIVAVAILACHSGQSARAESPVKEQEVKARKAAWERVERRLEAADKKIGDAAFKHATGINAFFEDAKKKTRGLAEELLSLEGKWEYITRSQEEYRRYLRENYEEQVMKPAALREVLEGATRAFLKELDAIENELLVAVEADLADSELSRGAFPGLTGKDSFAQYFRETAEHFDGLMKKNLQETVGREITSFVVSEVATRTATRVATAAAARLGVSAAILGGSVGTTVATLGVGLAIGLGVDYLLDMILEALGYDPAGEISKQMDSAIEKLKDSLVLPSGEQMKVMDALLQMSGESPDRESKLASLQARRQILSSGAAGMLFTLNGSGNERSFVWRVALERMVLGTSVAADRLAWVEKEWGSLQGLSDEQAKKNAAELLSWRGTLGAEAVLHRLKGSPEDRIRAAKAAALLYGARGQGVKSDESPRGGITVSGLGNPREGGITVGPKGGRK